MNNLKEFVSVSVSLFQSLLFFISLGATMCINQEINAAFTEQEF